MKKGYDKPDMSVFELRQEERVAAKVCEEAPDMIWVSGPDKELALCSVIGTNGDNPNVCKFDMPRLDGEDPVIS